MEAPKALSGVRSGKGCRLLSRLGCLGERRELPPVRPKRVLDIFLGQNTSGTDTNTNHTNNYINVRSKADK